MKNQKARNRIGYVGASIAMSVILVYVPQFISIYYTDVVGLSAVTLGSIMLLTKVLDGATDIVMGMVIDRTHSKWGKALPWILAGGIGCGISLYLMFNVPVGMSSMGITVFCIATYFLTCPFFGTVLSVAQASLIPMLSSEEKERTVLGLIHSFSLIVVTIFVSIVTPVLISAMGESYATYRIVTAVYAVLTIASAVIGILLMRENAVLKEAVKKVSIKDSIHDLFRNKYFVYLALGEIFYNTALVSGANNYFAKYVMGDISYAAVFTIATGFTYFALIFTMKLRNRFKIRNMLTFGFILMAMGCLLTFLAGNNLVLVIIAHVFRGIGILPLLAYGAPLTGQIADYSLHQTGNYMDGIIYSGYSMGAKIGTGLGSALIGWIIGIFGYDGLAEIQSAETVMAIQLSYSLLPMVLALLAAYCFSRITVEDDIETIQAELKNRHLR